MGRVRRSARVLLVVLVVAVLGIGGGSIAAAQSADWPTVQNGAKGINAQVVQHLLRHAGNTTAADGIFGPETEAKVKEFQTANGLPSNGVVDAATWEKLVVESKSGDKGEPSQAVQALLNKHGYAVEYDGSFGAKTETALKAFQTAGGLDATGVADTGTWKELAGQAGKEYVLPLAKDAVSRDKYERPHHDYPAVDIFPLAEGHDVFASYKGTVTIINDSLCGRGVRITGGGDGARYAYCHFSAWSVVDGQTVEAGQKLGDSGNTGNSSEPHLHFGIFSGNTSLCPQTFLLAIYDGEPVPDPLGLPSSGCTF